MKIFKIFLLLIMIVMISSCSMFSPVKLEPPTNYLLTEIPEVPVKKHSRSSNLLVLQPEAAPAYASTGMAYSVKPYQIAYFGKNRWAETPSQMLYRLIVKTLQNTHRFHAIVTPPNTGRFDYILSTQLLELVQDFTQHPITLRLTLRAQINRIADNRVMASKYFSIQEPVLKPNPYSGVFAANRAAAKILKQLASFTLKNTT